MTIPRLLRALAILIALAGVVDPAVTASRTTRPELAVIAGDSAGDAELALRVARELGERFTVIPAPFAAAAATVIAGSRIPASHEELASPVFAVTPGDEPGVWIDAVYAPARAALDARVSMTIAIRIVGAQGRTVETTLRLGDVIIDRATRSVASADERQDVALTFVPTVAGAAALRVSAAILGSSGVAATTRRARDTAATDLVVDVRDERWAVLFFDSRPSWLSTFVRRAIERDPRFVVTSRVRTSRNVSTDAGRPPATLDDLAALSLFDVVVIGAPESIGERDVTGLDAYLRRRGGSVVLLLDERANGPYDRLTGVRRWDAATGSAGFVVQTVAGDSGTLRASAIAWPAILPAGAQPIAMSRPVTGNTGDKRPVIWRAAAGSGQLVVSGALDSWRYRDPGQSRFDSFWRETVASAAASGSASLEVVLSAPIVTPRERTELTVTLRDASFELSTAQAVRGSVSAVIETPDSPLHVQLWPDGVGRFRGAFRAPATAGSYRLTVSSDGFRAETPLVVSPTAARGVSNESDLLSVWAGAHGGQTFAAATLRDLVPTLQRTLKPVTRRETWYPMRSAWWIVPFALLLGAEWLWRRRRGLA